LYEDVLKLNIKPDLRWLDLGCGHQLLTQWRVKEEKCLVKKCKFLIGLDCDFDSLRAHKTITKKVRGDAIVLPFRSNTFDLITANMVVEHLDKPESQLIEIKRILKPRGRFIFHTNNILGYTTLLALLIPDVFKGRIINFVDGRKESDIFPTFYRLNSEIKIKKISKLCGFKINKIAMNVSTGKIYLFPLFAIIELLWIKLLMAKPMKKFRTNIISILEKPIQ
jgi:ubiquinone/menaquinone biosynthesis C-methylase UbiE